MDDCEELRVLHSVDVIQGDSSRCNVIRPQIRNKADQKPYWGTIGRHPRVVTAGDRASQGDT